MKELHRKSRRGRARGRLGLALLGVITLGAVLRLAFLGRHYFWVDEGFLFDLSILPFHVSRYVNEVWRDTTYNPFWALVVWLATRYGGVSLWVVRLPSCVAGVLAVALTYPTARCLRLDRTAALAAALLMALCWPQVEYSQQILPYAGVPLFSLLVLWGLGRVARADPGGPFRALSLRYAGLAAACALHVANQNSFLMLVPLLGGAVFWIVATRGPSGRPRLEAPVALACLVTVALVALVFYLPKSGEGYRSYLDPYYLATFRGHRMIYGPFLDPFYLRLVPRPHRALDAVYFGLSRAYDALLYSVNLFSPTYVTPAWGLATLGPVGLIVIGTVVAARGRRGRALQALGLGLALTLGMLGVLSTRKLYPIGGIRQVLFLTPVAIVLAAVGWRAALRSRPRVAWTLTALCLVAYASRVPSYYAETSARLDDHTLLAALRASGTTVVVSPAMRDHIFELHYMTRGVLARKLYGSPSREFRAVAANGRPFLLYMDFPLPLDDFGKRPSERSWLFNTYVDDKLDLSHYDVRVWAARAGGPFRGGQPNPGAFLYGLVPKPGSAPPEFHPLVGGIEPGAERLRPAAECDRVVIDFDLPIDPRALAPDAIQLLALPALGRWEPPIPVVPTTLDWSQRRDQVILKPLSPLPPNTYMVRLAETLRSRAGRRRAGPYFSSFQVVAGPTETRRR